MTDQKTIEVTDSLKRIVNAVSKDQKREQLKQVQVLNDKVHACNGHILVELHNVVTDGFNNGEAIYLTPEMIKAHKHSSLPIVVEDDKVITRDKKNNTFTFTHQDVTYPEVDRVKIERNDPQTEIMFTPSVLIDLMKCFDKDKPVTFRIYNSKSPVKVTQPGITAVLMICETKVKQ